ncbi:DUF499 domain-containing protein [Halosegnis longus]|uniref:DUF499 domain-containing protein n=1 Tax=Halosegnis longus TaxID=2216012 RepID=UPI00129DADBA|nr:DUF499 domain-containing protein [Halosegnis longus]
MASALSHTLADTVTLSEELRTEGRIDGQVKLYNTDRDDEFEADAETFFKRTVSTHGLEETLSILRDSLNGDDPRNTHVLYGPYGAGKSHQMVAFYHCFNSPEIAGPWTDEHVPGMDAALPTDATTISVSIQYENDQYEYLWEPFFEALEYDPGSFASGGYPGIKTIEEAIGDRTVAFIVDELEDWWDSLNDDRRAANRGFLQALMEATAMDSLELYTIMSVLRQGSAVHDILDREDAVQVNMNSKVSKRDVLLHRLIDDVETELASEIIDGYLEAYDRSDYVTEDDRPTRDEFEEIYPIHPELIDTLESRYYKTDSNQNTRGMIYLFSTILLELREETDLITHGDIDAEQFEDELTKINRARPDACTNDIDRIDDTIDHGRRILNTILLYSLNDSQGEGANVAQIVMGAYQTGDRIAEIYIQLEELHGIAWHLHKLNGKYAIRDKRNPNALIRNAAGDVSETAAKGEIATMVEELFGHGAYTVGFRMDDLKQIPDSKQVKVIIKDSEWTADEVRDVITDEGRGRSWRNTFLFVQPKEGSAIESGTRYIDKARYVEGARQVLAGDGLDDGIKARIRAMKNQEEEELQKELRRAYGDVIDGDDLLNEFDDATRMQLDVFVIEGDEYSASTLIDEAAADPFDLESHIWPIAEDLLSRKGETTIEAIYEAFLTNPQYPIPGSVGDVIDAAKEALADAPILIHTPADGFSTNLEALRPKSTIIHEDDIETWGIEEIESDLRSRFSQGTTEISVGDYHTELASKTDVRIDGDEQDRLFMAIGRLIQDDAYILRHGAELLTEPELDAAIRDVSMARIIGASDIADRLTDTIETDGRVTVEAILREIRQADDVYLPKADTETAIREAVVSVLADDYLIEANHRYQDSLADRDPLEVTLVPVVPDSFADEINEYLTELDGGETFDVATIQNRFGSAVTEAGVRTHLLRTLGTETAPRFTISSTGSTDPSQWMPGYPFQIYEEGSQTWTFGYTGDSVTDLRSKWRSVRTAESPDGPSVLEHGFVKFVLEGNAGVPTTMQGAAETDRAQVNLTLEAGQDDAAIEELLERLSDDAFDIDIDLSFTEE